MVPWKELQPRAFSIMPLVWNVGSIFGPTLGGALANPRGVKAGEPLPPDASLLERFPYALPNMIASIIFIFGIITGILFLEETLAVKKDQRDYGLILGDKLKAGVRSGILFIKQKLGRHIENESSSECSPLLKPTPSLLSVSDEETGVPQPIKKTLPPPSIREVLHYQSIMNLVVYTLLALHNIAFDQLIPIFMHHPVQDHSSANPDFRLPLKFSGGFGLQSRRIGLIFTLYGVWGMLIQFFVFPPVARTYGVLRCLRVCAVVMPFIYLIVPFTTLLPTQTTKETVIFLAMIVKGVCTTFAFPSSTILLTNSASSLRILGTLNGLATSCGALGRALGPAIGGTIFTIGVQKGYIIAPWWMLAAIAVVAAVPTLWLVEGEGFGGEDDNIEFSDDEEESDEAGPDRATALEAEEEEHEAGYGGVGPRLSRTNTVLSAGGDVNEQDYVSDDETRQQIRRQSPGALRRKDSRKMSGPIGMSEPIGRRYSSSLGQSFGSAGSYQG